MITSRDTNLCSLRICLEHILCLNKLKSESTAATPEQSIEASLLRDEISSCDLWIIVSLV